MPVKLNASDAQDIADIFYEYIYKASTSMHAEIDSLAERFNIPLSSTHIHHSIAARNRLRALIKHINGTETFIPFVVYMVETKVFSQDTDTINKLNRILAKYGYTVITSEEKVVLRLVMGEMPTKIEERRTWIQENAPSNVIDYLRNAQDKLGRGEWAESLSACRNALEVLTTMGSFSNSLDELIRHGIITKGRENRKMDAELLRSIYGFCSTIGSHSEGRILASEERARLGVLMTEAAVYFLVKLIKVARDNNIILNEWR
jgi:hypothetical protein